MFKLSQIRSVLSNLAPLFLFGVLLFSMLSLPVSAQQDVPGQDLICNGPCPLLNQDQFDFTSREGVVKFILAFARLLVFIGVGVSVLAFIFAGGQFLLGQEENGKKTLRNAVIGLVIILLSFTAVSVIVNILQGGLLTDNNSSSGNGSF